MQGTYGDEKEAQKILSAMLASTRQCWEQGMMGYALWYCGEKTLLRQSAHDMVLRQSADGRLCNVEDTPAVTDSAFNIPAVWHFRDEAEYRHAALRNVDYLLHRAARAQDGTLFHVRGTGEVWADSAAFVPYALALTGYHQEAYAQMRGILEKLYLPQSGLYAHIWDERAQRLKDERAWGVGNGWILTGLARTARIMPQGEEREWMLGEMQRLLERMLSMQDAGGGFHDVLDDPSTFVESESTAMVALTLMDCHLRGIRSGNAEADGMVKYLQGMIDEDGFVHGASSSPCFDRPGTSVEAQAHVLMLESILAKR